LKSRSLRETLTKAAIVTVAEDVPAHLTTIEVDNVEQIGIAQVEDQDLLVTNTSGADAMIIDLAALHLLIVMDVVVTGMIGVDVVLLLETGKVHPTTTIPTMSRLYQYQGVLIQTFRMWRYYALTMTGMLLIVLLVSVSKLTAHRSFAGSIENDFRIAGLRAHTLMVDPSWPEDVVERRQIVEGVRAVAKIPKGGMGLIHNGKISLKIFQRDPHSGSVRFDGKRNQRR